MIPYYHKELLLFPHIQLYIEQKPEIFHDCDTTDIIRKDLSTSYDNSEFEDNVFEDNQFCNDDNEQSIIFDNEIYKSTKLTDNQFQHPRLNIDSEIIYYKPTP